MKGRLPGHTLSATIDGLTRIGGVEQHRVDHGPAPVPMTGWARDALAEQAPTDPGQRQALVSDPGEDLAHDPGCALVDLITSSPSASLSRDIAIAEGSAGEDTHGTRLGTVALSAPTALKHLGSLVLGEHALELQQQTVLRGVPDRTIEEDRLRAGAGELLNQQDLMRVAAGEAIGSMDVDDIDGRPGDEVTQTLQSGSDQTGAAMAVVDEQHVLRDLITVVQGTCFQLGKLAINGLALSLLVRRDPSVDGDLWAP